MSVEIPFQNPDPELAEHVDDAWFGSFYKGKLFHGTGRFHKGFDGRDKSKPNGKVEDIFDCVARDGLQPQADHVAKLLFESDKTVSLTRERIYARYYAELFGADNLNQTSLLYRFGESEAWKAYYFGVTRNATLSRKNAGYTRAFAKNLVTRFSCEDLRRIRDVEFHRSRWLMNKVAIAGNYPVIFGVDRRDIPLLTMPYGLGFFEDRSKEPIQPAQIKIVEVPLAYVTETRDALRSLRLDHIQVVPMELAEIYSFRQGLRSCMAYSDKQ
jgi:hypothetical protein